MSKKEIIIKLDNIISSNHITEEDKKELIQVKKEIEQSSYMSEVITLITSSLLRILGNGLDLFQ